MSNLKGLKCWLVHSGNAGDAVQCEGIAEKLGLDYKTIKVTDNTIIKNIISFFKITKTIEKETLPKIIIASGHKSIGLVKRILNIDNNIYSIYLKNPGYHIGLFNFVWAPLHDNLNRRNVFSTLTSPNKIEKYKINNKYQNFINNYKKPIIGILVGGKSKHFNFGIKEANELCTSLTKIKKKYSANLIITCSRRTDNKTKDFIQNYFKDTNDWVWNGQNDNPYNDILNNSDFFIVTSDSINMISEAATTGKPIYVYKLPKKKLRIKSVPRKLVIFFKELENKSIIKWFNGNLEEWTYKAINPTQEIANEIIIDYNNHIKK
ncbi:MAG: mitochondrial fission ELM1 family protein [Alphaproteobacteria bacterium]|jgi:mitochondrial fission protein ELM1